MTAISKITSKGQTTVPQAVRAALKSKPGDFIAWEIDARGKVGVRRMTLVVVPAPDSSIRGQASAGTQWRSYKSHWIPACMVWRDEAC